MQEFQEWFSDVKAAVKELSDRSGDSKAIEAKLHDLQVQLTNQKTVINDITIYIKLYLLNHLQKLSYSLVLFLKNNIRIDQHSNAYCRGNRVEIVYCSERSVFKDYI